MNNVINMGIDVGYGLLKVAIKDPEGKILAKSWPSIVGSPNPIDFKPNIDKLSRLKVNFDSHTFYVGSLATIQSKTKYDLLYKDWVRKEYFKALFYTGIGNGILSHFESIGKKMDVYDVKLNLVTGLPVSYFKDKQILEEGFSGKRTFRLGDDKHGGVSTFNVDINLQVVPQPFGTFYNIAFDTNGELRDDSFAQDYTAIVDIGNYTTDLTVLYGGDYIQHLSSSTPHGMAKVTDSLMEQILNIHNVDLENKGIEVINSILENKVMSVFGKQIDVSELVSAANDETAAKIITFIKQKLGDAADLGAIIVTGGGATVFYDIIKENYIHTLKSPGDPSLTNVIGYLKLSSDLIDESAVSNVEEDFAAHSEANLSTSQDVSKIEEVQSKPTKIEAAKDEVTVVPTNSESLVAIQG